VIETFADESRVTRAQKNAQDALAKYPDLAGMGGLNSYTGPPLSCGPERRKADQVKIVCFDSESDTLNGIAAGQIYGTIVQKPMKIGQQTIANMAAYLRGDKNAVGRGKVIVPPGPSPRRVSLISGRAKDLG